MVRVRVRFGVMVRLRVIVRVRFGFSVRPDVCVVKPNLFEAAAVVLGLELGLG